MSETPLIIKELRLDKEDVKKISDWFNEKSKKGITCQVCDSKRWFPHSVLLTPVVFNLKNNRHERRQFIPTVMVECNNCGNYLTFSAVKVGIDHKKYIKKEVDKGSIND